MPNAPFAGLLVVDFGVGAVGVEIARLLAEYGADVVKVESYEHPDFIRGITPNFINPSFASSSRSKRSLGVNLKTARGRELVHALIRKADVVVDNNASGVMQRIEMDAETLHALNDMYEKRNLVPSEYLRGLDTVFMHRPYRRMPETGWAIAYLFALGNDVGHPGH